MKRKDGVRSAMVYARFFAKPYWCPTKRSCQGCTVIVPRPSEDDPLKDLSLDEILLKPEQWRKKRQQLILNTFDKEKSMIRCMHCRREVPLETDSIIYIILRHCCLLNNVRVKSGRRARVCSNLFKVHEWCTDKGNCKSCIQIVDRQDEKKKNK